MRRLACTILALSLGAACGPTKPNEVPPLAPRPDPGTPVKPARVPGVPDPEKPPTGPGVDPTPPPQGPGQPGPVTEGNGSSSPAAKRGRASLARGNPRVVTMTHEFRAAAYSAEQPARAARYATDAGVPIDASSAPAPDATPPPSLPPIPDGGLPPDANRLQP